jgi:hypothetical protein
MVYLLFSIYSSNEIHEAFYRLLYLCNLLLKINDRRQVEKMLRAFQLTRRIFYFWHNNIIVKEHGQEITNGKGVFKNGKSSSYCSLSLIIKKTK